MAHNPATSKPIVAVFDFDGTITQRDTLLPFFAFIKGLLSTCVKVFLELPALIAYSVGGLTRQQLKERFIRRFLSQIPARQLSELACAYAEGPLMDKVKPIAIEKLRWHQKQGHRCILVSATLDIYLKPWADKMGFDDLICSELDGNKLKGLNCWGAEKKRRLEALLGPKDHYKLYVYGDSKGDQEILALADYPFYRKF